MLKKADMTQYQTDLSNIMLFNINLTSKVHISLNIGPRELGQLGWFSVVWSGQ